MQTFLNEYIGHLEGICIQNLIKFPSLNLSLKMPLDCKSITSICGFNTDVVVLTQTMGLLNHLKPLLCYVMLCEVRRHVFNDRVKRISKSLIFEEHASR